jgi:hypothetical protein
MFCKHHSLTILLYSSFLPWRKSPPVGQDPLIVEVSRSHSDSPGRVTSLTQRPLRDNTQHSQEREIYAPGGIRTHIPSKRVAAEPSRRPRSHWDRPNIFLVYKNVCTGRKESPVYIENNFLLCLHNPRLNSILNHSYPAHNSILYCVRMYTPIAYYTLQWVSHNIS